MVLFMIKLTKILTFAFALLFSLNSFAQLNDEYISTNVKSGQIYEFSLLSIEGLTPVPVNPENVFDSLKVFHVVNNEFKIVYQTLEGFKGDTYLDIEYYGYGNIPGIPLPFYTQFKIRSNINEVSAQNDYYVSASSDVQVSPLLNDTNSDGTLSLSQIAFLQNCSVTIQNNQTIDIVVLDNNKPAFVQYVCEDEEGISDTGSIMVSVIGESTGTIDVQTHNKTNVNLIVASDYTIDVAPENGVITEIDNHCWEYKSDEGYNGMESITFINNNGDQIAYELLVHDKEVSVNFVSDDEIYTAINESIEFNVFENDMFSTLTIVDYSAELTYLGAGVFTFAPETDFQGDKVFFYTIFNGIDFLDAEIVIHVDNFSPHNESTYQFTAIEGIPLSIEHNSPYENYTFQLISAPSEGSVIILGNGGEEVHECGTIEGNNTIIYTSESSQTTDIFEVEYCTNNGNCEIVRVNINIISNDSEDCYCVDDCVFSGDLNNDGIVNISDVLVLGLNMGEAGEARVQSEDWIPQNSSSWDFYQSKSTTDLSYLDANGDGIVGEEEMDYIDSYFGNVHNLLPKSSYQTINTPITLVPQQTSVDSGEWLFIDIHLGDTENAFYDLSGVSFDFNINPDVIDSSTVVVDLFDESWFTYGAGTIQYWNQPTAGNLQIGFSRVGQLGATGGGPIGTLGFIVEEGIEGFRLEDNIHTLPLSISNPQILDVHGNEYALPEYETSIDIHLNPSFEPISQYVGLFPNPANDIVTIKSTKYSIESVELFTIDGILIQTYTFDPTTQENINIQDLPAGAYVVKVTSNNQLLTQKLIKI